VTPDRSRHWLRVADCEVLGWGGVVLSSGTEVGGPEAWGTVDTGARRPARVPRAREEEPFVHATTGTSTSATPLQRTSRRRRDDPGRGREPQGETGGQAVLT
jgi:hypothetical protein